MFSDEHNAAAARLPKCHLLRAITDHHWEETEGKTVEVGEVDSSIRACRDCVTPDYMGKHLRTYAKCLSMNHSFKNALPSLPQGDLQPGTFLSLQRVWRSLKAIRGAFPDSMGYCSTAHWHNRIFNTSAPPPGKVYLTVSSVNNTMTENARSSALPFGSCP